MSDFSKGAAWMRGAVIPITEAQVGVTDWGITHSDAVYDVVPVPICKSQKRFTIWSPQVVFGMPIAQWWRCAGRHLFPAAATRAIVRTIFMRGACLTSM